MVITIYVGNRLYTTDIIDGHIGKQDNNSEVYDLYTIKDYDIDDKNMKMVFELFGYNG